MELSRKQIILIALVSGAILLMTVAAILIFTPGDGETVPEPTATVQPTVTPAPTATPTIAPSPTVFRLPLVPLWDTPQPSREPADAVGAFMPRTSAPPDEATPAGTAGPWVGADEENTWDILAVGLREGRAVALLLLRMTGDTLTVLALPGEDTLLSGDSLRERGESAAELVADGPGFVCRGWMALDLGCLPAVLEITGPLAEDGAEDLSGDGRQRAEKALALMSGALIYLRRASLLKYPALKRAVGNSFASSLTVRELWSLFWALRKGPAVRELVLPMGERAQNNFG